LEGSVSLLPLLERVMPEDLIALKKSLHLLEPLDGFGSVLIVSSCDPCTSLLLLFGFSGLVVLDGFGSVLIVSRFDRCTSLLLLFGFCGLVAFVLSLLLLLELSFRWGLSFSSLTLLGILLGFRCGLPLVSLEDRQEVVDAVRLWLSFLLGCFGGVDGCFGSTRGGGVSSKYTDSSMPCPRPRPVPHPCPTTKDDWKAFF
jgi:hypothetical protein